MQVKFRSEFKLLLWGIVILFLFTTPVWADLYYEQTTTDYSSTPGGEKTIVETGKGYVKSDKMKTEDLTNRQAMIIRLDKELIWEVDHDKKTYSEMTFEELEKMAAEGMSAPQMSAEERQQMEEMLKSMPPEQREMMEKMMGGMMETGESMFEPKVTPTGKKEKLLGYTCEIVDVTFGAGITGKFWVSDKILSEIEYSKFLQRMPSQTSAMEEFSKMKGFPLKSVTETRMGMIQSKSTSVVTKLKTKKIGDQEFEIPKGYKKVAFSDRH
ncbi:MAG: DUF4412 domain-containing protein [Candidatus Zixiibacteriota bacterium]